MCVRSSNRIPPQNIVPSLKGGLVGVHHATYDGRCPPACGLSSKILFGDAFEPPLSPLSCGKNGTGSNIQYGLNVSRPTFPAYSCGDEGETPQFVG